MLVLTRRQGEAVRIGDGITIEVLRVKGKQVRIRIAAPAEVRVLRDELSPHRRNATVRSEGRKGKVFARSPDTALKGRVST